MFIKQQKWLVKSFVTMHFSKVLLTLLLCLFEINLLSAQTLDIKAASALIMDETTGKVLWEREAHTKRYPASTTKIVTAMTALERAKLDQMIQAPKGVDQIGEASIGLKPSEPISIRDLTYAALVKSANDASYALALHIAGSVKNFAELMNEKAKQLGCKNTSFKNPHGLNEPGHLTTAYDLALIAREAMKNPQFREMVKTSRYKLTRNDPASLSWITSKNRSLEVDPTADGIKTGWTIPAGQCFVGSATRDGKRIITVILKSTDWIKDNAQMLDWAFEHHEWQCVAKEGEPLTQVQISNGMERKIKVGPLSDLYCVNTKGAAFTKQIRCEPFSSIKAPIRKGMTLGIAHLTDATGHVQKVPLVALDHVEPFESALVQKNTPLPITAFLSLLLGSSVFTLFVGSLKVTPFAKLALEPGKRVSQNAP